MVDAMRRANGRGIIASRLRSDGRFYDKLHVDGGPSATMTVGHLRMEGREVFKNAIVNIAAVMTETMEEAGVKPRDIDWFVPHQANRRILEGTVRKLGIRENRDVRQERIEDEADRRRYQWGRACAAGD